jgi:predicted ATPase
MLTSLSVRGYRSIRDLELDLSSPVTVVLGPNGSGKTNLYRAMYLLTAAAEGQLARTLAEEGGVPSVLWAGPRRKEPVRLYVRVDAEDLAYELSVGPNPPVPGEREHFALDPEVKEERVYVTDRGRKVMLAERKDRAAFLRDGDGKRVTQGDLWKAESLLVQLVDPYRFPATWAARSLLQSFRYYHHFRTDGEAPQRQPQIGIRTPALAHDGRDLAAALQTIVEIGDGEALARAVDAAFPGASVEVMTEAGRFSVLMSQPGLMRPLHARELSDGTLRYLCLLAALLSPRPPPFLALNEPETSLHPDLLGPLGDLIAEVSGRTQVWVTTHAEPLARRIEERSGRAAMRVRLENGATLLER